MEKMKLDHELLLGCRLKSVPKNRPVVTLNPSSNKEANQKFSIMEKYDDNLSKCHKYSVQMHENEFIMVFSKECPCSCEGENTCSVTSSFPLKKFIVDENENLRDLSLRLKGSIETTLLRLLDNGKDKMRDSRDILNNEMGNKTLGGFSLGAGILARYAVQSSVVGSNWVFLFMDVGNFEIYSYKKEKKKWEKIEITCRYPIENNLNQNQKNNNPNNNTKINTENKNIEEKEILIENNTPSNQSSAYIIPCNTGDAFLIASLSEKPNSNEYKLDLEEKLMDFEEITNPQAVTERLVSMNESNNFNIAKYACFIVPDDTLIPNQQGNLFRQMSSSANFSFIDTLNIDIPKISYEDLNPPQTFQPISVMVAEKKSEIIIIIRTIVSGELLVTAERDFILLNVIRSQDKFVGSSYTNDNYTATSIKELTEKYRRTILLPAMIDKDSRKTSTTASGLIILKYKKKVK